MTINTVIKAIENQSLAMTLAGIDHALRHLINENDIDSAIDRLLDLESSLCSLPICKSLINKETTKKDVI